jgi:hypothetical protein
MVSDVQYFIPRSYWFSAGYQGSFWYLNYFYNFFCNLILNFWMWLLMAGFFFSFLSYQQWVICAPLKEWMNYKRMTWKRFWIYSPCLSYVKLHPCPRFAFVSYFSEVLDLILFPLLHKHWFLTRASGILCCVMYWRSIAEEQYLILNTLN